MAEWPVIHLKNHTAEQLQDPGFLAHCHGLYAAIKPKRAEAIEAALSVEGALDLVLMDLLVGTDESKREIFREFVLFPEFCSSFQKWKILSRLSLTFQTYFETLDAEDLKTLKRDVKELMDDRNKFAHGDLFVDAQDFIVYLRYFENGTKWLAVTEEFLNKLIERASRSSKTLTTLHEVFRNK